MSKVRTPVLEPVRAAIAFARANVSRVMGVLIVFMLLNISAAISGRSAFGWALAVLATLAGLMAQGALLRRAFADEHPGDAEFRVGPQGFQFAKPELRLLGATLLLAFMFFLGVLLLLFLAFLLTIIAMALGHGAVAPPAPGAKLPPEAQMIVALLMMAFAIAGLWVAVRVCLYPAATIAERKIQVFSTWRLTEGRFWSIVAAIVVVAAPAVVLAVAEMSVSSPYALTALAFVSAAVNAFVEAPLLCGLYADLYRTLRNAPAPSMPVPAGSPGLAGPWG